MHNRNCWEYKIFCWRNIPSTNRCVFMSMCLCVCVWTGVNVWWFLCLTILQQQRKELPTKQSSKPRYQIVCPSIYRPSFHPYARQSVQAFVVVPTLVLLLTLLLAMVVVVVVVCMHVSKFLRMYKYIHVCLNVCVFFSVFTFEFVFFSCMLLLLVDTI